MKVRFIVSLIISMVLALIMSASIVDGLGARYLKSGLRGEDVRILQEYLSALGYDIAVDRIFGPQTDKVVRQFQKEQGLAVDGIVGPQTIAALQQSASYQRIHVVTRGDTLSHIAKAYDVSLSELMDHNQLTSTVIYPGLQLRIPTAAVDQEYIVKQGENLSVIAKKFGLTALDLAAYNGINDPNRIRVGQQLAIPAGPVEAVAATAAVNRPPRFNWPVSGQISSPYGWRDHPITKVRHFHGGIDIAVPQGTIVKAAASGIVIQAEWMGDYGYGVVIDHGGGYTTWYGHNTQLLVKKGDAVKANQPIARAGSTGLSTGPHLDFRIKYNQETINPLGLLP
ncbi:MAG: peptidoglycan DD-metalloendopeptidase family protein [Firmicutes bacterium]|jgi:LysM repeat protein|nr:peptidoglycan DD-metalloendopeptidase family protein [Bacillota bacterium]NLL87548.1 peptidoglycan DD-metalloendopeptidase family protein [Bacillota bacterium]HKM17659.1 peptidoglycan DD-metalloendopeptidase family protein [Limnochordia bacterium]